MIFTQTLWKTIIGSQVEIIAIIATDQPHFFEFPSSLEEARIRPSTGAQISPSGTFITSGNYFIFERFYY